MKTGLLLSTKLTNGHYKTIETCKSHLWCWKKIYIIYYKMWVLVLLNTINSSTIIGWYQLRKYRSKLLLEPKFWFIQHSYILQFLILQSMCSHVLVHIGPSKTIRQHWHWRSTKSSIQTIINNLILLRLINI